MAKDKKIRRKARRKSERQPEVVFGCQRGTEGESPNALI